MEAGLLTAFEGLSEYSQSVLATNIPIGSNCNIYIKYENSGKCLFTKNSERKSVGISVVHSKGRFLFLKEKKKRYLEKLFDNDPLVFRYCEREGKHADCKYSLNPNDAFHDIAGIYGSTGTVFGLIPHPERVFYGWHLPDCTKTENMPIYVDGRLIFESMVEYLKKRF